MRYIFFLFVLSTTELGFANGSYRACEKKSQVFFDDLVDYYKRNFNNFLDNCAKEFPEIKEITSAAQRRFNSPNLKFQCSSEEHGAAWVSQEELGPFRTIYLSSKYFFAGNPNLSEKIANRYMGTLLHEIMHLENFDNQTPMQHNKGGEISKKIKRVGKIKISKQKVDRVYLLQSACQVANSYDLHKGDALRLKYQGRGILEIQFEFINLCQESMTDENLPVSKNGAVSFCTKLESSLLRANEFKERYKAARKSLQGSPDAEGVVRICTASPNPDQCGRDLIEAVDVPIESRKHLKIYEEGGYDFDPDEKSK